MNDDGANSPEERAEAAGQQNAPGTRDTGGGAQDMGALLEQFEEAQRAQLRRGDLVEGTVVLVDKDDVLVDIGGKMEAVLPTSEVQADREALRRGEHVTAVVVVPENAEGRPVISINRARAEMGWRNLHDKFQAGDIVEGEVVDHNKGGLIVSVDGVRGFVPLSQIVELRRGGSEEEVEEKLRSMRGQHLFLKIIEMNRRRNRLILSERAAAQERRAQQKERLLAELQPDEVRHGRVSSLTDFGAFVDLGGADGLIHLSELSWGQVQHPSQVLKVGQDVDVKVVGVDRENKKIALSLKQAQENPWDRITEKYQVGSVVPARITKLAQFGAFAEVEPGVEGLIHISELSDERITHPKQVVREGEDLQLRIIGIDPQRHRLRLSLRQVEETGGGFGGFEAWGGTSYASGSYADEDEEAPAEPAAAEAPAGALEAEAPAAPPEAETPAEAEKAEPAAENVAAEAPAQDEATDQPATSEAAEAPAESAEVEAPVNEGPAEDAASAQPALASEPESVINGTEAASEAAAPEKARSKPEE